LKGDIEYGAHYPSLVFDDELLEVWVDGDKGREMYQCIGVKLEAQDSSLGNCNHGSECFESYRVL
jgi:hypothetical protein